MRMKEIGLIGESILGAPALDPQFAFDLDVCSAVIAKCIGGFRVVEGTPNFVRRACIPGAPLESQSTTFI